MVSEAVSDAAIVLHTMICCKGIMRRDGRRRLILDGHTLPGTDLCELLEYAVLPYFKNILEPRDLDNFAEGLTCMVLSQGTQEINAHIWLK